jgi:predicted ester cyclase
MTPAGNKSVVRQFLEAINDADTWDDAVMARFFSPTYQRHLTPTSAPLTAQEHRERATRLRVGFPDAHATVEDIVADGDRVVYRLTIRGTHRGAFLGIAPTQKQVTVSFIAIVRLEHGQFAEEWGGLDQTDLLRQLGATVSVKSG